MTPMNIPAELLNNAPAIIEHGGQWVVGHIEGQVGDFAWKQIVRAIGRVFPPLAEVDPRELAKRMSRLETALYGLRDELSKHLELSVGIEAEILEPAAQDFVSNTFSAVMESPDDVKRDLLGRLIAQRLFSETESTDELHLRQAAFITGRINRQQLWALGTLYLINYPPLPSTITRDAAYLWMDENLWPVLQRICVQDPTAEDLAYLASLGAVLYDQSDVSQNLANAHAPPVEHRILQVSGEHFPQVPGQRFGEFYLNASQLYVGEFSRTEGVERISLAPYTLSPPGFRIAFTIVQRLRDEALQGSVGLRAGLN